MPYSEPEGAPEKSPKVAAPQPPKIKDGQYTITPQLSIKDWKVPRHVQRAIEQAMPNR